MVQHIHIYIRIPGKDMSVSSFKGCWVSQRSTLSNFTKALFASLVMNHYTYGVFLTQFRANVWFSAWALGSQFFRYIGTGIQHFCVFYISYVWSVITLLWKIGCDRNGNHYLAGFTLYSGGLRITGKCTMWIFHKLSAHTPCSIWNQSSHSHYVFA